MIFSKKTIKFILEMKRLNNRATRNDFKHLGGFSYYLMTSHLRNNGIIYMETINKDNQKVWKFTEKGEKIAQKLKELIDLIGENEWLKQ